MAGWLVQDYQLAIKLCKYQDSLAGLKWSSEMIEIDDFNLSRAAEATKVHRKR